MSMPALFKGRLSIPVIGAPLFIISVPDLVIAQCKAGVVGSFPALNARPQALLDEWIARIKQELAAHDKAHPDRLSAPFAVNQIVHKSNNRLDHDLAVCEKHKVPMMITSLGAREELNQAAHGWGCIVFHDVINQKFAHKAVEKGADGLILVSAGNVATRSRAKETRDKITALFEGAADGSELAGRSDWQLFNSITQFLDRDLPVRGGDEALVQWADCAVGSDRQWPGHPRRADTRRRFCLYRFCVHCHRGGQRGGGLQADDHHLDRGRYRLFEPVHGRARQLFEAVDCRGGNGPRQSSGIRRLENEFRHRRFR